MSEGLRPLIESLNSKLESMQDVQTERHTENVAKLTKLEINQEHLEESVSGLEKRVVTLESFLWKVKGSIATTSAIGTILGAIVATLIELWVRKH